MSANESSISVKVQNDTTGTGTSVFTVDRSGAKTYAPYRHMQDSNIIHDRVVRCVDLISTAVDRSVFAPVTGGWQLAGCQYVNTIAGTDGSAVTADIMACNSGDLPSAGTTQLTAADSINLKATINVPVAVALATTKITVRPGGYFSMNVTGTLTAVVSMITCEFVRVE